MSELHLSNRVKTMTESATIAMSQQSRAMKAAGKDVISLSLGEPDFNTPDSVKAAAKLAITQNFSKYPPVQGYEDLKLAICTKFQKENNLSYQTQEILVSTGAKQSIANVILALIDEGDEVLLPAPYWVSYVELIKLAGGIPVPIYAGVEQDFKITPQQLAAAISPKTKLMIYSSPCNPSGSVFSKSELINLATVLQAHPNIYVLADEIYEYINFTSERFSMAAIPFMKNRVATVNGVAKGFAMTGWRIGYLGAPEWLVKACAKIQGQITSGANTIAQKAAIAALNGGEELTFEMQKAFKRRRDLMVFALKEIKDLKVNQPKGAFYIFPDVSAYFGKKYSATVIHTAQDLCMYLLYEALVAVVPGDAFGAPNCIRISYASSDEILIEAVNRMHKALKQLT